MRIEDQAVLITGASRGLGAALAREIAGLGARLVLVAREAGMLERVAAGIRATGGRAHALAIDVADEDAAAAVAGVAAALEGPIAIAIHNASTLGRAPLPLLLDTRTEDFRRTLEVNLVAPFRITRALAGSMVLRGSGLIVNITSDASVAAYPAWGMYGASKAALDHLGRIWATELAGSGVRFLSIDPGEMDTDMHRRAIPDADASALADPADVARKIVEIILRAEELESGSRVEARAALGAGGAAGQRSAPGRETMGPPGERASELSRPALVEAVASPVHRDPTDRIDTDSSARLRWPMPAPEGPDPEGTGPEQGRGNPRAGEPRQ